MSCGTNRDVSNSSAQFSFSSFAAQSDKTCSLKQCITSISEYKVNIYTLWLYINIAASNEISLLIDCYPSNLQNFINDVSARTNCTIDHCVITSAVIILNISNVSELFMNYSNNS